MYITRYLAILLFLSSCQTSSSKKSDNEAIDSIASLQKFLTQTESDSIPTPLNFEKIKEVKGDLDKDNKDELIIVYNIPSSVEDVKEREVQIFRMMDGNWVLWHKTSGILLNNQAGGMMGDPFEDLSIENNAIVVSHFGGSREKWTYTHRYRFQNNEWYLIGATINFGSPCDKFENYDYNLLTGLINCKIEIEKCDESGESKGKPQQEKFSFTNKPVTPFTMDKFVPGENEVKIPKQDKSFYF